MDMPGVQIVPMQAKTECRRCKKITLQIERVVTDNLPASVKVMQCTVCGIMGVCLIEALTDV